MPQDTPPVVATDPNASVAAPVATPAPVVETSIEIPVTETPVPTIGQVIAPETPVNEAPVSTETPATPTV